MSGFLELIKFAAQSGWNLFSTLVVIFFLGCALVFICDAMFPIVKIGNTTNNFYNAEGAK